MAILENFSCSICNVSFNHAQLIKDQSFFITIPLESQLQHTTETMKLGEQLNYKDVQSKQENSMCDVYDGKMYQEILAKTKLKNDGSFTLTFNSNGVPVFKSSTFSVWPILCFIDELPPLLRKKHVILCGL